MAEPSSAGALTDGAGGTSLPAAPARSTIAAPILTKPRNGEVANSTGSLDGGSVLGPLPNAASFQTPKLKRSPYLYAMTSSRDRECKELKAEKKARLAAAKQPEPGPQNPPTDFFNLQRPKVKPSAVQPDANRAPDPMLHRPPANRIGSISEQLSGLVINEEEEGVKDLPPGMKRVSFSSHAMTNTRSVQQHQTNNRANTPLAGSVSASTLSTTQSSELKYFYAASTGSLKQFLDKDTTRVYKKKGSESGSSTSIGSAASEDPLSAVALRNDQWKTVTTANMTGIGISPTGSKSMANFGNLRRSNLSAQQLNQKMILQQKMARSNTVAGAGGMRSAGLAYGSANFQQNGMNGGWSFDNSSGGGGNADWGLAPGGSGGAALAHATPKPQPMNRLQARMKEMEQAVLIKSASSGAGFPQAVSTAGRQ